MWSVGNKDYSQSFSSSEFNIFPKFKIILFGQHFLYSREVIMAVNGYMSSNWLKWHISDNNGIEWLVFLNSVYKEYYQNKRNKSTD